MATIAILSSLVIGTIIGTVYYPPRKLIEKLQSHFKDDVIFYQEQPTSTTSGDTLKKVVALTIDDAPYHTPEDTLRILDCLDQYGVKATFLVIGSFCLVSQ